MSSAAAHRIGLVLVATGALAGIALLMMSGGGAGAETAPSRSYATEEERLLHEGLAVLFGSPEEPRAPAGFEVAGLPAAGANGDAHLDFGRRVWRTQCLHCHGYEGGADTGTAALLNPRPRDFGRGIVKFTSTRADAPATRADLERTIRQGLPYTAMSGFDALPESSLQTVVDYSHWLLLRAAVLDQAYQSVAQGVDPDTALDQARQSVLAANTAPAPVEVPPQPPPDAAATARGAALYADAAIGCAGCHGADGKGRGPLVWDPAAETWILRDSWGLPAQPRDLSDGQFHGGSAPADLFRRLHAGVKGTPMPAFGDRLSGAQLWDLVAYLQEVAK